MKWYVLLILSLGCLLITLFIFLKIVDYILGKKPSNLGIRNGKLAPMKMTPKGVNSYTDYPPQKMQPIPYTGDQFQALQQMVEVLASLEEYPRITFYEIQENYIWARDISKFWKWKDDIEFYLQDNPKVIHFRSSPRYGTTDGGFNRRRMIKIRSRFESLNLNNQKQKNKKISSP